MSPNKRIFLNIVATYGRSLFSLVCGLFSTRWVLIALGQVDYGLYGVIGGLVMFISFFNSILGASVGRFYAFAVGTGMGGGGVECGIKECRKWFTIALLIHTVVPAVLMFVGYPIGQYAIRNVLTIPVERVDACVWVFRFVCMSCLINMITIPFHAMYIAKQYIAELTIYSFVTTALNLCCLYFMVSHPGAWLVGYTLVSCALQIAPLLIIAYRAVVMFPECRIVRKSFIRWYDVRKLISFAGWNFFGAIGNVLKNQGIAILVNMFYGPRQNAAVAVANSVSGQAQSLSGAMLGAFMPAITNACGAGDRTRMMGLVGCACKFGALLILPFCIPLSLEINYVMNLWLKNPPPYACGLCVLVMVVLLFEKLTTGQWVAISAVGKIAAYQFKVGVVFILTLPIAWCMMSCGLGVYSVGYALCITQAIAIVIRLNTMRELFDVSPKTWAVGIFMPICMAIVVSVAMGLLTRIFISPSFVRTIFTTTFCWLGLFPVAWFLVMKEAEREFVQMKVKYFVGRIKAVTTCWN